MRVIFLALILARAEGVKNEEKVIKMALIHDLAETRVSDLSYVQKNYVKADEEAAINNTLYNTSLNDFEELFYEFEKRETLEAKVVKDADNLDIDIELKEIEEQGHKLPEKWQGTRMYVRTQKLYTKSAKRFWDKLQDSDPSHWHIISNKWTKEQSNKS